MKRSPGGELLSAKEMDWSQILPLSRESSVPIQVVAMLSYIVYLLFVPRCTKISSPHLTAFGGRKLRISWVNCLALAQLVSEARVNLPSSQPQVQQRKETMP